MGVWSAENATKAYLSTLKMGKREKEADMDIAEFISALAAGNNAQLMVAALGGAADYSVVLALVAAAHQTSGRVICILSALDQLQITKDGLGHDSSHVEFVVGEAKSVLMSHDYSEADFVVVDCNLGTHENVVRGMHRRGYCGKVVVGYNALCNNNRLSSRWRSGLGGHLLPIGRGLVVTRIAANDIVDGRTSKRGWVVKVDKRTGEEHVFRIRSMRGNEGEAVPFRSVSL